MHNSKNIGFLATLAGLAMLTQIARGQSAGVPVYEEGQTNTEAALAFRKAVEQIRESGKAIGAKIVREQLRRPSCQLNLPAPQQKPLTTREIWQRARQSHLRVGWSYQCTKCDEWHNHLAGGYALTKDGVVATGHHVVQPPRDLRAGFLIAADDFGKVFPVVEVLAANRANDACIVRIAGGDFAPLPLSTNAAPGDTVYCFSDPQGRQGFFSQGIVNRFYELPRRGSANAPRSRGPVRIHVSAEWSLGSSGAALLDEYGNAIGHISTITTIDEGERNEGRTPNQIQATPMIFREAVSAHDVLALVLLTK